MKLSNSISALWVSVQIEKAFHVIYFIYAACTDRSKTAAQPQKACNKYKLCVRSAGASQNWEFKVGLVYLNSLCSASEEPLSKIPVFLIIASEWIKDSQSLGYSVKQNNKASSVSYCPLPSYLSLLQSREIARRSKQERFASIKNVYNELK